MPRDFVESSATEAQPAMTALESVRWEHLLANQPYAAPRVETFDFLPADTETPISMCGNI